MNERNTCLNVLLQVFGQEKKLNDALKEALSCEDFDSRDRRFIRRLSFGTVERYETLLAVLKKLSSVK